MSPRRPIRRRVAFSATEVIVCVAVLGMALIPVMGLFTGGARQQAFNEYYLMSLNMAQHVADRVKDRVLSESFGPLADLPPGSTIPLDQTPYAVTQDDLVADVAESIFKLAKAEITHVSPGLAEIAITIEWTYGSNRRPRSKTHRFLLCRPDLSLTRTYAPRQEGPP